MSRPAPTMVLRSPPFPGVAAHVAAVGKSASGGEPILAEDTATLIDAIRTARVGGAFWGRPLAIEQGTVLLRCAMMSDVIAACARAFGDAPVLAILPDARWSSDARAILRDAGIASIAGDVDPWPLLDRAGHIEAPGDDEIVLLGLLAGVPVHCTRDGRFAGCGLTSDAAGIPVRAPLTLDALVDTTVREAVRYRDCFSGRAMTALAVVELLGDWRRLIQANRAIAVGAGIAVWKRREVAQLLWNGSTPLRFARSTGRAIRLASDSNGVIAAWPSRIPADLPDAAAAAGIPLHRVEDGFIRSVGLGSNLHPPLSIVADAGGIYYDPRSQSDLETLLATADFLPAVLARARRLSDAIVQAGISKYSSGIEPFRIDLAATARRVLVVGQVEDDLSVRLGGGDVAGNRDLLARARAAEPDAYILFKPHPDVDAGHRTGRIDDAEALHFADQVVRDVSMPALLDAIDGVHVLTSLAGYEALLRGRDVTVHGSPFYAGWGLTRDLGPTLPRRTRKLSIEQLTAAALILYPRYLDPLTGLPCPPETLVDRIAVQRRPRQTTLIRARRLQGWLRRALTPIGRLA